MWSCSARAAPPADGFELQLGTNVLGHFAPTGLLLATRSVAQGALPQLRAATEPGVRGGRFFRPSRLRGTWGPVTEARPSREAADPAIGKRLWAAAEELTGVSCL